MAFPDAAERSGQPRDWRGVTCVLLHVPGSAPPRALLDSLGKRGVEVRVCTDRFGALAELCGTAKRGRACVLAMVEPDVLSGAEELAGAARRFVPGVVIWRYDPGAARPLSKLAAVPPPSAVAAQEAAGTEGEPRPGGGRRETGEGGGGGGGGGGRGPPALRLAGEGSAPNAAGSAGVTDEPGSAPRDREKEAGAGKAAGLLTEEELAMLLADDEPRRRRR